MSNAKLSFVFAVICILLIAISMLIGLAPLGVTKSGVIMAKMFWCFWIKASTALSIWSLVDLSVWICGGLSVYFGAKSLGSGN